MYVAHVKHKHSYDLVMVYKRQADLFMVPDNTDLKLKINPISQLKDANISFF